MSILHCEGRRGMKYLARLHANGDPILKKLDTLGIRITDLASAFHSHANFPDVEIWPAEEMPSPDLAPAREILFEIVEHVERLREYFPPNHADCDDLMKKYAKVVRMIRHRDLSNPADLIAVMEAFTSVRVTRDRWIGCAKDLPKEEEKRWSQYRADFEPFLTSWRKYCYPICLEAVRPALEIYDRLRHNRENLIIRISSRKLPSCSVINLISEHISGIALLTYSWTSFKILTRSRHK